MTTTASRAQRVLLLGASGSIGRACLQALRRAGHEVVCVGRRTGPAQAGVSWHPVDFGGDPEALRAALSEAMAGRPPKDAELDPGTATGGAASNATSKSVSAIASTSTGAEARPVGAVISCLASRTGAPAEAWVIDRDAHLRVLEAAQATGVRQFVLLSAICVQKPRLPFQHAKLAFEAALQASGLCWSIVRPTAYFKSITGQIDRMRAGKPYLVFGDGRLTACKPIGDEDLADFLVRCLHDPTLQGRILPIGGPGPALTPLDLGALIAQALGLPLRVRSVPVGLLDAIAGVLGVLGRVVPPLAAKAEFARIGRYYATESMLVWDAAAGRYDAQATPSTGHQTLSTYLERRLRGELSDDRGEHAVF